MFKKILAFLLLLTLATTTTNADVPRPRGVPLSQAFLYHPRDDDSWVCLDGSKTIRFVHINDDFCDCSDGSDEPGTSACHHGSFHCANLGHQSEDIPSSRVNDGICDCCDASDEYAASGICSNTCQELGRAAQQQRQIDAELHKKGAARRAEMISKGIQLRTERDARRAELDRQRSQQEALKVEKEDFKRNAEAAETEALEVYKELQRELDAAKVVPPEAEGGLQNLRAEAEETFLRYDANKDGFVEITELQVDVTLDRDRDGVVTVEEAKYFLDERERIDFDSFLALSWPRIKTSQMVAQGIFKPPVVDGTEEIDETELQGENNDAEGSERQHDNDDREPEPYEGEENDDDEEGAYEEDDVGVGSVQEESTPTPEYDPETQRLIELANAARNALADVDRDLREIERELKDIDEQNAKDYGVNETYASLDGECFTHEDREYVYTLCPFDRAAQKPRSGGSETTLGRWDSWVTSEDGDTAKYSKQRYSHGASCWNGPQRSTVVQLRCALEHRLTSVSEPNRCEYYFDFETPAACDDVAFAAESAERLRDEL